MNIARITIGVALTIFLAPPYLPAGIFDFISGVVSSVPKKNVLSFEQINEQLTDIEKQLLDQTGTLQEQKKEIDQYLTQVESGQKETVEGISSLEKSKALPPRVRSPLLKALTLQKEVLSQTNSILTDGKKLIEHVVDKRAPAVQQAIARLRTIAKKGKSSPQVTSTQRPENIISGIFKSLF